MQKKALHTLGNHAEGDFFTQKRETNIMSVIGKPSVPTLNP